MGGLLIASDIHRQNVTSRLHDGRESTEQQLNVADGNATISQNLDNVHVTANTESNRNSTIADKPRDAFVQYAALWLTP